MPEDTIHNSSTNSVFVSDIFLTTTLPAASFSVPITLQHISTFALIDSGASSCFIDQKFVQLHSIPLVQKKVIVEARVIDGRKLPPITHETIPVFMSFLNYEHSENIYFNVICSTKYPVVLGMSWLQHHNPLIDWSTLSINFPKASQRIDLISSDCELPKRQCLSSIQSKLQHLRFGHRNIADIHKLNSRNLVYSMDPKPCTSLSLQLKAMPIDCEACAIGKAKRKSFPRNRKPHHYDLLERICLDTHGPLPVPSIKGHRYFVTFSDDKSRYKFTYLLHRKSDVFQVFVNFKNRIEKRTSKVIKILYGDNAAEYLSEKFSSFLREEGITWQSTVPHCSEQNGIAERGHLT